MTLHFYWLHAPRWLVPGHVSRAMRLVLGVTVLSLLFGALRVVDVAISGTSVASRAAALAASGAVLAPDVLLRTEPTSAGAPMAASLVELPEATVEAVSL